MRGGRSPSPARCSMPDAFVRTYPAALDALLRSPGSNVAKQLARFGTQVETQAKQTAPARPERRHGQPPRVDRVARRGARGGRALRRLRRVLRALPRAGLDDADW